MDPKLDALNDWCEANFEYTPYIAEFFNTWTNLIYIIVGIWTWFEFNKPSHKRLQFCGITIMFIGIGSMAYHGTITRWGQAFDELAILYWEISLLYTLFYNSKSYFNGWYFYIAFVLFETILYWQMDKSPKLGWFLYHPLHTCVDLVIVYNLFRRVKYEYDSPIGVRLLLSGLTFIFLAFFFWLLDFFYCDIFGNYYLHAFGWHLLSGIAMAHLHVALAVFICLENGETSLKLTFLNVQLELQKQGKKRQ